VLGVILSVVIETKLM